MSNMFVNENYGESNGKKDIHIRVKEKTDYGTQNSTWKPIPRVKFSNPSSSSIRESDSKPQLKQIQFDKALIALVKKNYPIWDKSNKVYDNKEIKMQLWQSIASILNTNSTNCIVRWNVLKEKYLQYKRREVDAEKLEYIEELNFLDRVQFSLQEDVLYVKNNYNSQQLYPSLDSVSSLNLINNDLENYASDSISENELDANDPTIVRLQKSINGNLKCKKHRHKASTNSCQTETPPGGKVNLNEKPLNMNTNQNLGKEPEDLFGELVSSFLKRLPDETKAMIMIEIMSSLLKF